MGWKQEAKQEKQKYYGYYVDLCRKNNIIAKPYHNFNIEDHKNLKKDLEMKQSLNN